MRRTTASITPLAEATVLGGTWLAIYLLLPRRDFGGDDLVYAMSVDKALAGFGVDREFFHPHHPLFNPLVAGAAALLRAFDSVSVLEAGAAVAALLGALVVGGVVALARREGHDDSTAALAACVAGALAGFWAFATINEVYTLEALAVLVWLVVTGRSAPRAVPVGAALGAAVVAHIACVCLVPGTLLAMRHRRREAVAALLLGGVVAGVVYGTVVVGGHGGRSPGDLVRIMRPEKRYVAERGVGGAFGAARRMVATDWFERVPVLPSSVARPLVAAGVVTVALGGALLVAGGWRGGKENDPLTVAALGGLAGFAPLWVLFDAGNVEHAIGATPLLVAVTLFTAKGPRRRLALAALTTLAVLLVVVNGIGSALPRTLRANSRIAVIADEVATRLPPEAVILAAGTDPVVRLGLPYLSGRRVVDLAIVLEQARVSGRSPDQALEAWVAAARAAPSFWLTEEVLDAGTATWAGLQGIAPDEWYRVWSSVVPGRRFEVPADGAVLTEPFVLVEASLRPAGR